uniref:DUF2828 domain-containing protein n=1 Tax=Marseillevirus LCMAC201 TaxID=2506605 RepID=A0A481YXK3_9VIRU|nr:MAG: protein of unknown function DUF2828 [Marseillevirus LCMAC201]
MEEFYLIDQSDQSDQSAYIGWAEDIFSSRHCKTSVLLERSWKKSPFDTLRLLFYLRDCRGGKGTRYQFYRSVKWFMENHPDQFLLNFKLILQFGYWKDLLNIWDSGSELLRAYIIYFFCQELKKDYQCIALSNSTLDASLRSAKLYERAAEPLVPKPAFSETDGFLRGKRFAFPESGAQPRINDRISLAAKWAPTEKGAADRQWGFVGLFCDQLGWSRKLYRQRISELRNKLTVTERLASDRRWGEIDFPAIPTKSRMVFHNTLKKHCGKRYQKWCASNEIHSRPQFINTYSEIRLV